MVPTCYRSWAEQSLITLTIHWLEGWGQENPWVSAEGGTRGRAFIQHFQSWDREQGVGLPPHPPNTTPPSDPDKPICSSREAQGQGRSPNVSWGWGHTEGGVLVGVSLDSESGRVSLGGAWPLASPQDLAISLCKSLGES